MVLHRDMLSVASGGQQGKCRSKLTSFTFPLSWLKLRKVTIVSMLHPCNACNDVLFKKKIVLLHAMKGFNKWSWGGGGVSKIPGVRNIFYFLVRVNRFSLFLLYLWFKNRKWKSKLQLQLIRSDTGTFFCSVLWLGVLLLGWPLESNLLEFWAQIIHNVNDTKIRSSQTMGGKGAFLISVLYARDLWEVCVD